MISQLLSAIFAIAPSCWAAQPGSASPVPAKIRDLQWGKLNFLHTTDTHGWLGGHLQEPSYSADWGDYVSLVTHMRNKAEANNADLLVIDTGDRVEGNGLYDASDPKGKFLYDILRQQQIDVMSSGNHELYKQNTSETEYLKTVPSFKDSYIASNIDIRDPLSGDLVPLGPRFKKFTTKKQGIRIVAFGFLFDFTGNYNNTKVQPVEETIQESWFQDAIHDEDVDLFLVVGHVPVRSREYEAVYKAIRKVHHNTLIQFFGGHLHIRDYARYDVKSSGLASGRFLETIGFLSIDDVKSSNPVFTRRYIDNNLFSFYHHTGLDEASFPTDDGNNTSLMIQQARHALDLDSVHGCAPRSLWMSRTPYPSDDSIYSWLETEVLPSALQDTSRGNIPAFAIVNTGAIRFDVFKGPFTQDSIFNVSPFTSGFRYIKDVPLATAKKIAWLLNLQTKILAQSTDSPRTYCPLAPPEQCAHDLGYMAGKDNLWHLESRSWVDQIVLSPAKDTEGTEPKLLPGYTTVDDAGTDGDDTIHSPIAYYQVPNVIHTLIKPRPLDQEEEEEETLAINPSRVDLVYIDFIEKYISVAAKFAGLQVELPHDSDVYMSGTSFSDLILGWIKENWQCDEGAFEW